MCYQIIITKSFFLFLSYYIKVSNMSSLTSSNFFTTFGKNRSVKIHHWAFIISFAIGMFFVYVLQPVPKVIIKHPNPENAGKIIYKDNGDSCYKYIAEQVECPSNKNEISDHPLNLD